MRRELAGSFELDDDPGRIDRAAVHDFLANYSYWARGRARETTDALIEGSRQVAGLYAGGRQIGFARAVSDGHVVAYLADVYVLPEFRGRGLGVELVRFLVEDGPLARCKWILDTEDAHGLYRKFGFAEPDPKTLVRPRR